MYYSTNEKVNGNKGYNGFKLDDNKIYIKHRLKKASSIIAKAIDLKLQAHYFIVDSKCASIVANEIRKLNKQVCYYIDCERQNGLYELIVFSRETAINVENILNKCYPKFECCGQYNLTDNKDFEYIVNLCFSCCEDNETDKKHKRYFCSSQLTKEEKLREIRMMAVVVNKQAT